MGALGLRGITVEEAFGGLGLGYLEHVLVMEEVHALQRDRPVYRSIFRSPPPVRAAFAP